MDIRDWPIDKIMQLPDCCFGRRWPVSVTIGGVGIATHYDISEMAFPERIVVWSVFFVPNNVAAALTRVSLSLGDALPANDAQFDAFERVFNDLGHLEAGRRYFETSSYTGTVVFSVRQPIQSMGRRLVGRFRIAAVVTEPVFAGLVISSFPTEVPDWLLSGRV